MTTPPYYVPAQPLQIDLEIKRSKFLCFVEHANSVDDAECFIRTLREQHPQANHVCWAYIAGPPHSTTRSMSDDGEPNGTAGMPMLKILEHSGLGDIVVAVVRYFGGTKLGTGGLQRAYSGAVSQVLADVVLRRKVSRVKLGLRYAYAYEGSISRALSDYDLADINTHYGEFITLNLAVAVTEAQSLVTELVNITSGTIEVIEDGSKAI